MGFWDDPQMLADLSTTLGGMAGGFAQAAMPTRMPTPIGAVLGMGGEGMAKGRQAATQQDLAQQQVQSAQLQNQLTKAMMPAKIQLLQGLGGSAPMGVPQSMMQGGQSGSGGGDAGAGPSSNNYLVSPNDLALQARYAMATGQDRAAASIYGLIGSQAGGPGYAFNPNGGAFAVPGGGKDPSTLFRNSQATAAGGVAPALAEAAGKADIDNQRDYTAPRTLPNGQLGSYAGAGVAPPPAVSGSGGAVGSGPSAVGFNPNDPRNPAALATIKDPGMRSAAVMAAQAANVPLPEFVAIGHNESGWNPQQPNGAAGEVGPLQVKPGTGAMVGVTGRALGTPYGNTMAGALYFRRQLDAAGGNIPAAIGGYNTGDVTHPNPAYVQSAQQRVATFGGAPQSAQQPAPGISQTPLPGGNVQTTNTRGLMDQDYAADQKVAQQTATDVDNAQASQVKLMAMRQQLQGLPTGAGGEARLAIANSLATYLPKPLADRLNGLTGSMDPTSGQEFAKLALQAAGNQERETLGARGGFRAIQLYQNANPNLSLQPDANRRIINMQLVAQQADVDYGRGMQDFIQQNASGYRSGQSAYAPSSEFDRQWTKQNNPQVYTAAIGIMNGDAFTKWASGLTKQEGLRAIQIAGRIDPSTPVPMTSGAPRPASMFTQTAQ